MSYYIPPDKTRTRLAKDPRTRGHKRGPFCLLAPPRGGGEISLSRRDASEAAEEVLSLALAGEEVPRLRGSARPDKWRGELVRICGAPASYDYPVSP